MGLQRMQDMHAQCRVLDAGTKRRALTKEVNDEAMRANGPVMP